MAKSSITLQITIPEDVKTEIINAIATKIINSVMGADCTSSKPSEETETFSSAEAPIKFKVPSLEEVNEYAAQEKISTNVVRFWNYYNNRHWKDKNGNSVTDWKVKLTDWANNDFNNKDAPRVELCEGQYKVGNKVYTREKFDPTYIDSLNIVKGSET